MTKVCTAEGCENEARMAVRTLRPTRGNLYSAFYYDDRTAPKTAVPYCKPCGLALARDLVTTLVSD